MTKRQERKEIWTSLEKSGELWSMVYKICFIINGTISQLIREQLEQLDNQSISQLIEKYSQEKKSFDINSDVYE